MNHHFDRGSWLTLAISAVLLVWGTVCTLYFFSLPTDGWQVIIPQANGLDGIIYRQNVAGAQSQLEPGDRMTAVDGISPNQEDLSALVNLWKSGNILHYTVVRGGSTLTIPVALVNWTFPSAAQFFVKTNGGISGLLGELLFLVIAAVTFFKRPTDHAANTLFLIGILLISVGTVVNHSQASLHANIYPTAQFLSIFTIVAAYSVFFPPILIRLSLVFPHPKPAIQKRPFLEFVPFLIGLAMLPASALTKGAALWLWSVVSVVATVGFLIHSAITMKDALSRAQLFWGLWGMIVGVLLFASSIPVTLGIVNGVLADLITTLSNLSFGILGVTLSIAILRYRLFEISLIIRRTLLYSALTAVLGLIYFVSVLLLQMFFRSLTGQESDLALVLSTLVIAALFTPLRRRIQDTIDRRFYRRKYNAEQAMLAFTAAARSEVELETLADRLAGAARESLEPESVSLWLKKEEVHR